MKKVLLALLCLVTSPVVGGDVILIVTDSGYFGMRIEGGVPEVFSIDRVIDVRGGTDNDERNDETDPVPDDSLSGSVIRWARETDDAAGSIILSKIYEEVALSVKEGTISPSEAPGKVREKTLSRLEYPEPWKDFRDNISDEAASRIQFGLMSDPAQMVAFLSEIAKGLKNAY